jgi:predicted regulator of Ras-like GTPase activity (Roadblock/LC7/MglB family)
VTDDIRALSAQYAADPSSLVFLRLGEALRQRNQLEAALKVALSGLSRYPHLPDAHDLYARVLTDRHDFATAFDEWDMVLRLTPNHIGAHKGIGFLYYRAGEPEHALYHLRLAAELDPGDVGLRTAVERVAGGREIWDTPLPEAPPAREEEARAATISAGDPFAGLEGANGRLLLVDQDGLCLGGSLAGSEGGDVSEETAAMLAGTTREASRAARLLELGEWTHLTLEGGTVGVCLLSPTTDTSLLAAMDAGLPTGQLAFFAERAAKAARTWLERVR